MKVTTHYHSCILQINARGIPVQNGDSMKLLAFYQKDSESISKIMNDVPCGDKSICARLTVSDSDFPDNRILEDLSGFLLQADSGQYYVAISDNLQINIEKMRMWESKEDAAVKQEANVTENPVSAAKEVPLPDISKAHAPVMEEESFEVSTSMPDNPEKCEISSESLSEEEAKIHPEPQPATPQSESGSDPAQASALDSREWEWLGNSSRTPSELDTMPEQEPIPVREHMTEYEHITEREPRQRYEHMTEQEPRQRYEHMTEREPRQRYEHMTEQEPRQRYEHMTEREPRQRYEHMTEYEPASEQRTMQEPQSMQSESSVSSAMPSDAPAPNQGPRETVRKIQRSDLSILPRRCWNLANNSFLMHGYHNYNHLLLVEEDGHFWLGVPGVYAPREARASELFGFPQFTQAYTSQLKLKEEECDSSEKFGYWCRFIR